MTDGETGDRNYWILFQIQKFLADAGVRVGQRRAGVRDRPEDAPAMPSSGSPRAPRADTIDWPNLGYADAYAESFEIFDRLQQDGTIPAGVRFQLQYPTPLASVGGTIVPEDMPAVAASYEAGAVRRPRRALAALPHDRIAVQWDVAVEFGLLEGAYGPRAARSMAIAPALVALRRSGAGGRPGRAAPLLRRLRPRALQAARVAADAGRPRQRRQRPPPRGRRLGVVHRAAGPRATRATSPRCAA